MTANTGRSIGYWRRLAIGVVVTALASTSCSSEPAGESLGKVEQALDAGEFVVLNELKINAPGGADNPWQYIELLGTPSVGLSGFQVVVIDGANGNVVMVVDLGSACSGPCAIGTNGILIVKAADSDAGPAGHTPAPGATVVLDAQLLTSSIPNGNTAVLLIEGSVAVTEGTTVTLGDAGRAAIPDGDSLIDAVGWAGGGAFTGVTLTQSAGTPDAAARLPGRFDTAVSAWYNGDLLGNADGVVFDPTRASVTLPIGGMLTPGAPNFLSVDIDAGDSGAIVQDAAVDALSIGDVISIPLDSAVGIADVTTADAAADRSTANDSGGSADAATVDSTAVVVDGAAGTGGSIGTGGSAGAGGSGGTGGSTGSGGAAGRGGAIASGTGGTGQSGAGGTAAPPSDDSGCNCRAAGSPSSTNRAGLMLTLLAVGVYSRRRRKNRTRSAERVSRID